MLPSDHDGLLPPPAAAPNVFVYFTNINFGDPADGLRLFNFHSDFAVPANSTFTERAESTYAAPLPLPLSTRVTQAAVATSSNLPLPEITAPTGLMPSDLD